MGEVVCKSSALKTSALGKSSSARSGEERGRKRLVAMQCEHNKPGTGGGMETGNRKQTKHRKQAAREAGVAQLPNHWEAQCNRCMSRSANLRQSNTSAARRIYNLSFHSAGVGAGAAAAGAPSAAAPSAAPSPPLPRPRPRPRPRPLPPRPPRPRPRPPPLASWKPAASAAAASAAGSPVRGGPRPRPRPLWEDSWCAGGWVLPHRLLCRLCLPTACKGLPAKEAEHPHQVPATAIH